MPSEWTTFSQHLPTVLKGHDSLQVSLVELVGLCHTKALCVSWSFLEILWHEKEEAVLFAHPLLHWVLQSPLSKLPDLFKPQLQAAAGCRRTKPSREAGMNNLHSLPVLASAQSHTSS